MAIQALASLREHRPGRIRWALTGAAIALLLSAVAQNYPFTKSQCLRWAADRPTAQGAQIARVHCYREWGRL